jgi:uncharacterized membrane protein YcfT
MVQKYDRMLWVDLAKGVAIFLVAMHHSSIYERSIFSMGVENGLIWSKAELVFYNVRMPLFFLISGFLASGIASRRKDSRIRFDASLSLTYVYFLWSLILLLLVPNWPNDGVAQSIGWRQIGATLLGDSLAWYLWAIVMSFFAACLTRRLPILAVLPLAFVIGVLLQTYGHMIGGRLETLGRLLPFYMLGIRCPNIILAVATKRKSKAIMAILLAYILLQHDFTSLWDDYVRDLLGLAIGLMTAAWAANRYPRVSARLAWLGQRTLPVYVMHFPIVAMLGGMAVRHLGTMRPDHPLAIAFTPLLAALSVCLSLALYSGLRRMGFGWLFTIPRGSQIRASLKAQPAEHPV